MSDADVRREKLCTVASGESGHSGRSRRLRYDYEMRLR